MNERIQQLIEQATSTQGPTPYNPLTFEVFDKEKFAELIVQRTLAIVEAHTEIFQSDEARAMVEHIKCSVKTDFGVEE
jgi:hypothetical protein